MQQTILIRTMIVNKAGWSTIFLPPPASPAIHSFIPLVFQVDVFIFQNFLLYVYQNFTHIHFTHKSYFENGIFQFWKKKFLPCDNAGQWQCKPLMPNPTRWWPTNHRKGLTVQWWTIRQMQIEKFNNWEWRRKERYYNGIFEKGKQKEKSMMTAQEKEEWGCWTRTKKKVKRRKTICTKREIVSIVINSRT